MKAQKFHKHIVRSVLAVMTASLVTSCAYDSSYGGNYPSSSSNRGTGDSFTPLLIGAAAIGAIALAKRHNDKKRDRRNDHYRNYGNHHYNHSYNRRPVHNNGRSHINHSGHSSHRDRSSRSRDNNRNNDSRRGNSDRDRSQDRHRGDRGSNNFVTTSI